MRSVLSTHIYVLEWYSRKLYERRVHFDGMESCSRSAFKRS